MSATSSSARGLGGLIQTSVGAAAGGGWLALRWSGDVSYVFVALSAALAAYGLLNAGAVAGGAWFGPIAWPRPRVRESRRLRSTS